MIYSLYILVKARSYCTSTLTTALSAVGCGKWWPEQEAKVSHCKQKLNKSSCLLRLMEEPLTLGRVEYKVCVSEEFSGQHDAVSFA